MNNKSTSDKILSSLNTIADIAIAGLSGVAAISLFNDDKEKIATGNSYECIDVFRKAYDKMVEKKIITREAKELELSDIKFIVEKTKPKEYRDYLTNKLTRINDLYHIYY